ncbi:hypothetical protein FA048_05755 [Pedobacter polaris]|uniref:Uncharacterized protein n=1 Tax=Pedobacter polaris TaxID=2571273 RepID=A0A4U1CWJ5_9SPHI|nr:hypothetical protein [Pedobacter polaris]TKC13116.1 hypothetical protein FA048_05755 [Pedobacter polaris]
MKSVYFLVLISAFSTLLGCNKFKSDHPEAELTDQYATNLTAASILKYADQIDKNLLKLPKSTSLVYMIGDLSFYVEKYIENGKTVLITEHAYNGAASNSLKEYYFRNDSLILEKVKNELSNDDGLIIKNSRTFLRSNTVFKIERRTASSNDAINSLPYIDVPLSLNNKADKTFLENVKTLNEVLNGSDKFEMVFENITTYPDSRYIVLKSKNQNSYTASILVKNKDQYIDSLLNNPIDFKDQKLAIKWIVEDKEAVYVPVASNTSASGLNR